MMRILPVSSRAFFIMVFFASLGRSAAFEPLGYGAPAKAVGGAYAALAEDGTAAYWNPAGLASVREPQGTATYEDLYGLGLLRYGGVGYTHPNIGKGVFSAHLLHMDTQAEASFIHYAESTYMLSYGRRFLDGHVDVGTGFRFYNARGDNHVRATGLGFDVGAILRPFDDRWRLGVMWQDLNRPRITWNTGARDYLPYTVRMSLAGRLGAETDLALQYDRYGDIPLWRFGGVKRLFKGMVALRVGLHCVEGKSRWTPAVGGGLRYKRFDFDYAWDNSDDLGSAQTFSAAMRFGP